MLGHGRKSRAGGPERTVTRDSAGSGAVARKSRSPAVKARAQLRRQRCARPVWAWAMTWNSFERTDGPGFSSSQIVLEERSSTQLILLNEYDASRRPNVFQPQCLFFHFRAISIWDYRCSRAAVMASKDSERSRLRRIPDSTSAIRRTARSIQSNETLSASRRSSGRMSMLRAISS